MMPETPSEEAVTPSDGKKPDAADAESESAWSTIADDGREAEDREAVEQGTAAKPSYNEERWLKQPPEEEPWRSKSSDK